MQELLLEPPKVEWHGDVATRPQVTIHRDGRTIARTYSSRTILWDVVASKLRDLTSPALTDARSLEWSRTGVVAWAAFQSGVRAWSDCSGEPVDLGTAVHFAQSLAFQPDAQRLAVSDLSSIHILDVLRRRSVRSLEVPPTSKGIAFSRDGARVAF